VYEKLVIKASQTGLRREHAVPAEEAHRAAVVDAVEHVRGRFGGIRVIAGVVLGRAGTG